MAARTFSGNQSLFKAKSRMDPGRIFSAAAKAALLAPANAASLSLAPPAFAISAPCPKFAATLGTIPMPRVPSMILPVVAPVSAPPNAAVGLSAAPSMAPCAPSVAAGPNPRATPASTVAKPVATVGSAPIARSVHVGGLYSSASARPSSCLCTRAMIALRQSSSVVVPFVEWCRCLAIWSR